MKTLSLLAIVVMLASVAFCGDDKGKPQDLPTLKTEADQAVARAQAADPKDCTKECLDAAHKLVELSDQYFTLGNVKDGHAAMDDAGRFAVKAGRASVDSKKRRKDTEIGLRKLQKRISDIEQTLNFDDRASVHDIVTSISKARSDILMSMFDQPKKELGPDNKEKP
jgi:hypothetical protein